MSFHRPLKNIPATHKCRYNKEKINKTLLKCLLSLSLLIYTAGRQALSQPPRNFLWSGGWKINKWTPTHESSDLQWENTSIYLPHRCHHLFPPCNPKISCQTQSFLEIQSQALAPYRNNVNPAIWLAEPRLALLFPVWGESLALDF